MSLFIRTQDKRQLLKVNDGLFISNFFDNTFIGIKNVDYVGIYTTEERALEVLDEIQKKINLINLGHDFGSPMTDLNNPTYIYEMPKE